MVKYKQTNPEINATDKDKNSLLCEILVYVRYDIRDLFNIL